MEISVGVGTTFERCRRYSHRRSPWGGRVRVDARKSPPPGLKLLQYLVGSLWIMWPPIDTRKSPPSGLKLLQVPVGDRGGSRAAWLGLIMTKAKPPIYIYIYIYASHGPRPLNHPTVTVAWKTACISIHAAPPVDMVQGFVTLTST